MELSRKTDHFGSDTCSAVRRFYSDMEKVWMMGKFFKIKLQMTYLLSLNVSDDVIIYLKAYKPA